MIIRYDLDDMNYVNSLISKFANLSILVFRTFIL